MAEITEELLNWYETLAVKASTLIATLHDTDEIDMDIVSDIEQSILERPISIDALDRSELKVVSRVLSGVLRIASAIPNSGNSDAIDTRLVISNKLKVVNDVLEEKKFKK